MSVPRSSAWSVEAIGVVRSDRVDPIDDGWDAVAASITLLPPFEAAALQGLDEFNHVDVVYLFHRVDPAAVHHGARHPRGNDAWPEVGVFAQRVKDRPNRIGLTTCELLGVEGTTLRLRGLDAIDGTPVLDLKPHMVELGPRSPVRQPAWSTELMAGYH